MQVLGVTPPSFFGMIVGDRFDLAVPTCTPPSPMGDFYPILQAAEDHLGSHCTAFFPSVDMR